MKTIKEVAIQYAETRYPKGCVHDAFSAARNGFIAGYNTAQKWISVDDEFPPQNTPILLRDK